MDYQPSDTPAFLLRIRESVLSGDWVTAERMSGLLADMPVPGNQPEAEAYLSQLRDTVMVAKAARANALASRARVSAARRFHTEVTDMPRNRQEHGVSADF